MGFSLPSPPLLFPSLSSAICNRLSYFQPSLESLKEKVIFFLQHSYLYNPKCKILIGPDFNSVSILQPLTVVRAMGHYSWPDLDHMWSLWPVDKQTHENLMNLALNVSPLGD